jgi:23S rRNA pseudouridine1911/1915/1917 synthase
MTAPAEREERLLPAPSDAGQRLDLFLARRLPDLSRSRIQQLIREGRVTTADRAAKASERVRAGVDIGVSIPPPVPADPEPEALPLTILYDDADIVVIDKPAGIVVHPAPGHARGTVVNALLHHVGGLSGVGGRVRPGIVHRLDRGTSGVMIVAKHDAAHRDLARQFHDRTVRKEYVALVWGAVRSGTRLDQPIGRDPRARQRMSTRARRARPAITDVLAVEPLGPVSYIRVTIGTGRTHQIRVHLSEAGYPIVGDAVYHGVRRKVPAALAAVTRLNRPFLHAARLEVAHPSDHRRLVFDAALPPDLASVVEALRAAASGGRPVRETAASPSHEAR